jgi:hypothetical protein
LFLNSPSKMLLHFIFSFSNQCDEIAHQICHTSTTSSRLSFYISEMGRKLPVNNVIFPSNSLYPWKGYCEMKCVLDWWDTLNVIFPSNSLYPENILQRPNLHFPPQP